MLNTSSNNQSSNGESSSSISGDKHEDESSASQSSDPCLLCMFLDSNLATESFIHLFHPYAEITMEGSRVIQHLLQPTDTCVVVSSLINSRV